MDSDKAASAIASLSAVIKAQHAILDMDKVVQKKTLLWLRYQPVCWVGIGGAIAMLTHGAWWYVCLWLVYPAMALLFYRRRVRPLNKEFRRAKTRWDAMHEQVEAHVRDLDPPEPSDTMSE